MSHGRFIAVFVCVLGAAGVRVLAQQAAEPGPIRMSWGEADHASGIYHVKADAKLVVHADNTSREAAEFSGEILFGAVTKEGFKVISVTPVERVMVGPGRQARVPLSVTFGAAGAYEVRLRVGAEGGREVPVAGADGRQLHCIFAPRVDVKKESPWIAFLPQGAAKTPGVIADYAAQTSVHRFLIDEQFLYDAATNIGLGFGASTGASAKQIDAFLEEAAKAKVRLTLRVHVPLQVGPAVVVESINAFRKYVEDAVKRSKGSLAGIVISPVVGGGAGDGLSDAQRSLFRSYYIAGHEAARKADKNVQMLGPGSAALAAEIFRGDAKLTYIDSMAIADAALEPLIAAELLGDRKLPLHVLPRRAGERTPAAAALAARAAVAPVPAPEVDNGVTAHLLGAATLAERLRLALPSKDPAKPFQTSVPFVAVFQGDGYSVAAIAGFGAGTELDGLYPSLALATLGEGVQVTTPRAALEPEYPNLQVGDDSRAMRVVDAQGSPIDCRHGGGGDHLFVPAGDQVAYLLEANTAEELVGSLRPAVPNNLPLFDVRVTQAEGSMTVRLRNISAATQGGSVRVLGVMGAGEEAMPIGEALVRATEPGAEQAVQLPLMLPLDRGKRLVVEISVTGAKPATQRMTVPISP